MYFQCIWPFLASTNMLTRNGQILFFGWVKLKKNILFDEKEQNIPRVCGRQNFSLCTFGKKKTISVLTTLRKIGRYQYKNNQKLNCADVWRISALLTNVMNPVFRIEITLHMCEFSYIFKRLDCNQQYKNI